jgi:phytoene dehydrogenase-like protein
VRTETGERLTARQAVVADVVAPHLYGRLLREEDVPSRTARAMAKFQIDPSTVKVDWALDGPVPWATTPPYDAGTVHVADSVDQMCEALSQVTANAIPARPFMLTGQMTKADPTRSPAGTEAMWAYTHVPQHATRDAGDEDIRGVWDRDDCERFADRMQARMEEAAPGFTSRITARRVLGPLDMEARDANLVRGAINGGTSQLHQELIFRPVPGMGRAETQVKGLYLGSASAHPGGGVHGAPGMNAARAALAHARVRRLLPSGRRPTA